MQNAVYRLTRKGTVPEEGGFAGWLGRYEAALHSALVVRQERDPGNRERQGRGR